jgi:WD40 repeat protein
LRAVASSRSRNWVACGGPDGFLSLWGSKHRKRKKTMLPVKCVTDLAATPDGRFVLVRGTNRVVYMLEADTLDEVRRFGDDIRDAVQESADRCSRTIVGCSEDGCFVFSGDLDGSVRVWALDTGQPVLRRIAHRQHTRAVCMPAGARWVATGGDDGLVRIWDLSSSELIAQFVCAASPSSISYLVHAECLCVLEATLPRPRVRLLALEGCPHAGSPP